MFGGRIGVCLLDRYQSLPFVDGRRRAKLRQMPFQQGWPWLFTGLHVRTLFMDNELFRLTFLKDSFMPTGLNKASFFLWLADDAAN